MQNSDFYLFDMILGIRGEVDFQIYEGMPVTAKSIADSLGLNIDMVLAILAAMREFAPLGGCIVRTGQPAENPEIVLETLKNGLAEAQRAGQESMISEFIYKNIKN